MIFTFSATGNSYAVAKRIAEATGDSMVDMGAARRYKRFVYDAQGKDVGFVFPVYYYGLPVIVREFMDQLDVRNPGRVYAVSTCAGESGFACVQAAEILKGRLEVKAMYDVVMPDNCVFYEEPPTADECKAILAEADSRVDSIIESIKTGEEGDHRTCACDDRSFYGNYENGRVTERFTLNDRCIECRICEDVCPEQIIKIYHRKPVWDEERCTLCLSCLNLCPKQAIEFGEETVGRRRYYNPAFYERTIGIPLKY